LSKYRKVDAEPEEKEPKKNRRRIMSILRKRGKEKIRFRIMNNRVTNRDFKYLKRLFLECLGENRDIVKRLNEYYKLIQVFFFYEATDPNVENSLKSILNDSTISHSARPVPAFALSKKNVGCIMVFVKHLNEFTQNREDIKDIEKYQKNGFFEELCHLVEQKGDSSIHPSSYWALWRLYTSRNLQQYGNEIIAKLDTDRNHYEVYFMMIKAYPKDWVVRYWKYFAESFDYQKAYEDWKKNLPINVAYARLITDYMRIINVLFVAERVPRQSVSNEHRKLLDKMKEEGNFALGLRRKLIKRDMGLEALSIVESLDENIFKTCDIFFTIILDVWKLLGLI